MIQTIKAQTIYFSRRRRQVKSHLTLNGRITTLVSGVTHIGVTFDTDYMGNSRGNHWYQGFQNIYSAIINQVLTLHKPFTKHSVPH